MRSLVKRIPVFSLAAAMAALMLLPAQFVVAQSSDEAYQIEEFNVSGDVSLEVQTSGGSIEVIGSENDKVVIEMYVRRRGNYIKPGKADLDEFDIEISQDGNTVKAIASRESGWGWNSSNNYSISFIVRAPTETRTRLNTSGGSLTAKNLEGSQELKTSGGSITTEGIRGNMNLKTSGGSINIKDIQGDTEANTSGGTIRVEAHYGDLDVKTSGGSISLNGIEGSLKAKTSGGSISAEVLAPSKFIDLNTSGGSISITIPEEQGYDLDLDGSRVYVDLKNFSGHTERDAIKGSMNGGGIRIKAKTSGGSVRLEYL